MANGLPKLIVLCGPTGSGKTDMSLRLARYFGGSIISADSRQLYKDMTIGTAKPVGAWVWRGFRRVYMVEGVVHYNLDWLSPNKSFSAAEFKVSVQTWIGHIQKNKQIPFLVGGTGLYIDAVVDNLSFPNVVADQKLRDELSKKTLKEMLVQLDEIDPDAGAMIDRHNPRRVIRALEVSLLSGVPFSAQRTKGEKRFDVLYLGMSVPKEELYARLDQRIDKMVESGLVDEATRLARRYSFDAPGMNSIGYREFRQYLNGEQSLVETVQQIKQSTRQYAKRQMTWFARRDNIRWCATEQEMQTHIADFLKT